VRAGALSLSAAAGVVIAGAIAIVSACLPDVEITPPAPAAARCGDGVISPDAGEECDLGDAAPSATLCNAACQVECNLGPGSLPFVDPVSHHCYFSLANATETNAAAACEASGAHVVRFVSEAEVSLVASNAGTTYWVGLDDMMVGAPAWLPSESTDEPGWAPTCPGCFAHVEADAADIPAAVDGGRRCVEGATGSPAPLWSQTACKDVRLTLCEREPVGTRTVLCSPETCFTVAATQKHYVVTASRLDASAAAEACRAMDGGVVVFGSREEREQVGYEIGTETALLPAKSDFWIGLSSSAAGAWAWDGDGGLEPLPWAVGQPAGSAFARRAYVLVAPGTLDSELARAQGDAGDQHYALCEIR
jgi:hypothetical protein